MFKKRFHINFQNMSHMPLRNVLTSSSVQLLVNKGCKAVAKKKFLWAQINNWCLFKDAIYRN